MGNNIWHIIEVILFILLIISFLLLSDNIATKYFSAIVISLNVIYIIIYIIHIRKTKKK